MNQDPSSSGAPSDGLSEEQVTRLLADAADAGPAPQDVTSRLDAVLADLVAERAAESGGGSGDGSGAPTHGAGTSAPVVRIASARDRRRRTWAPRLLVAAAVLGVAGVGISVLDDLSSGGSDSASAGDASGSEALTESGSGAGSGAESGGDTGALRENRDQAGAGNRAEEGPRTPRSAADALRIGSELRITDTASLRAAVLAVGAPGVAGSEASGKDDDEPRRGALDTAAGQAYADCAVPTGPGRRSRDLPGQPGHARRTPCGRPPRRTGLRLRAGTAAGRGRDPAPAGIVAT